MVTNDFTKLKENRLVLHSKLFNKVILKWDICFITHETGFITHHDTGLFFK